MKNALFILSLLLLSSLSFAKGFPAGTLITEVADDMSSVQVPIEKVKVGDTLLCFAEKEGPLALGKVTRVSTASALLVSLSVDTGKLFLASDQPVMLAGVGYITGENLVRWDKLVKVDTDNDGILLVVHITWIDGSWGNQTTQVYRLEVSTWHNFFANGLLVHN